jgi:para-nitrobenzyl esterase
MKAARTWLRRCTIAVLALGFGVMGASAHAAPIDAVIAQGYIRGEVADGVAVFKGLPFAAPPVGPLRWRPTAPPAAWTAPRDATRFGPACPQPERASLAGGRAENQSEDCLTLNVWAPVNARGLPVMVWLHGGGHRIGSGSFPIYDGTELARQGVVVVTINYRLGLLGYFAHPSLTAEASPDAPLGNYGTMDQIAALRWVQTNIATLGGDPKRVTVFGESAGGASTIYLLATPSARGLFAQAIVESGGGLQREVTLAQAEASGAGYATRAGLAGAAATASALRALTPQQLLDAAGGFNGIGFGPFVDGRLLPQAPWRAFQSGQAPTIPLMIGANSNEASVLGELGVDQNAVLASVPGGAVALRRAYGDLDDAELARQVAGDAVFVAPARWVARTLSARAPVFLYHFDYVAAVRRGQTPGARHGSEIPYVFKSWDKIPAANMFLRDEDRTFSAMISACWVRFAKTGAPICPGLTEWPAYAANSDAIMLFAPSTRVAREHRKPQLDLVEAAAVAAASRR